MKTFLLFLVFFLAGFTVVSGFTYWHMQNSSSAVGSSTAVTTNFSLAKAPSESLKGTVASMSGTVTWLSRAATKPVQIHASHTIQQGETVSTGKNGEAVVTINNEAAISLSHNTDVNFIQLLPINLVLVQNDGAVTYQNSIQAPISVRSFDLLTLLTQGIVVISADQENKMVTITVQKGVATEGYKDVKGDSKVITLNAGEHFAFDDTTKEGTVTGMPGFVSNSSSPFGH